MIIDFELLKGFDRTVGDALLKGVGFDEDNLHQRCAAFLKGDHTISRRRELLIRDLERFEEILSTLRHFPGIDYTFQASL